MFLTAHRVVHGTDHGINAYLYWHGRDISGEDPATLLDAPPGVLQLRLIGLPPPGNVVRSFVDIVLPDQSTRVQIEAILDLLDHAKQPEAFPAVWRFGFAAARANMELRLAPIWQEEVAELVGVARACILSYPNLRVTPRYGRRPGKLDGDERALCLDAAARRDTEAVLSFMRQLARARRLAEITDAIQIYSAARGDARVVSFLIDHVPALFSNYYMPTHGSDVFERFVEWGISDPRWADRLRSAAEKGGMVLAQEASRILAELPDGTAR